jgi:hypothetical protein
MPKVAAHRHARLPGTRLPLPAKIARATTLTGLGEVLVCLGCVLEHIFERWEVQHRRTACGVGLKVLIEILTSVLQKLIVGSTRLSREGFDGINLRRSDQERNHNRATAADSAMWRREEPSWCRQSPAVYRMLFALGVVVGHRDQQAPDYFFSDEELDDLRTALSSRPPQRQTIRET